MEEGWAKIDTSDDIPLIKIDTFYNQYKSVLLLLHFGFGNLPCELVYMILKDYVYRRPFIRIRNECIYAKGKCNHLVKRRGDVLPRIMNHIEIREFLKNNDILVPSHFK